MQTSPEGVSHSRDEKVIAVSTCSSGNPPTALMQCQNWLTRGNDTGQSAIELALVLPILLLLLTGTMTFGIALVNYMTLYEATSVGARQLAVSRGQGGDPCAIAGTAIAATAPLLNNGGPATGIGYTFIISSTSTSSITYKSNPPSCSNAILVQGQTVTIDTTYPCTLKAYGMNYAPNCFLEAKVTEITQ